MHNDALEPRVAKLETGLEILTRNVTDLATVVRDQGANVERELQKLAVGVTQAAAPRRTDWQTIIALIMLIMAIGSAVFWPLNQTSQDTKESLKQIAQDFKAHESLDNHPVGAALLNRLEFQLNTHVINNAKDMQILDDKLQSEIKAADNSLQSQINGIQERMMRQDSLDLIELRGWRNKAMGLSAPDATVPLVPRASVVK